jgi:hypothetical protein
MSDNTQPEQNQPLSGEPSPEELEAAQAANEFDALTVAQAEVATLQAKNTELADSYLRAKAETENARRRADEDVAKARKFAVESFAESLLPVADSLEAGLAVKEATPSRSAKAPKPRSSSSKARSSATRWWPSTRRRHQIRPGPAPGRQHGARRPGSQHRGQCAAKRLPDRRARAAPRPGHGGSPQITKPECKNMLNP